MTSIARTSTVLVALSLATLLLESCSNTSPTKPKPSPAPAVNPVKPNANARIQVQSIFGDPASWSSVYDMTGAVGSPYYFEGWYGGYAAVGRLGPAGNLEWFARLPFTLRKALTLPASVSVPGGMVVVGKHDTNGDGNSELGYAWLFTAVGNLVGTELYSSDTSDVWVNGAVAVSDTVFLLVGGERTSHRTNPWLATLALNESGQLAKRSQVVLTGMANSFFTDVVLDPAGPAGGKLSLFTTSSVGIGTNNTLRLHRVTVEYPALTSPTLDWSNEVPAAGPSCSETDLRMFEDRIYVCGNTDDTSKPPPSTGGYWKSGLAARLTLGGVVEWSKIVRLSTKSDDPDAIVPTSDGVFLVGDGARYSLVETKEKFGYGWIAKLATATGEVVANLTFGNEAFSSGFNTGVYSAGTMSCAGWTNSEIEGGAYQGWFCGIDVSHASAPPERLLPKPAAIGGRIGDIRAPGDRTR